MMSKTKGNVDNMYDEFLARCDEIADECEAEGYPAHGSNYSLRVENLMREYPDLFSDETDDDWDSYDDDELETMEYMCYY